MKKNYDEIAQKSFLTLIRVVCLVLLLVFLFVFFRIFKRAGLRDVVKSNVEIELGTNITIDAFLNKSGYETYLDTNSDFFHSVGTYKVRIKVDGETFFSNLTIKDTTSPVVSVRDLSIYSNEDLPKSIDFIERITELSDYEIEPVQIENQVGDQDVLIRVCDAAGNVTESQATLTILTGEKGPVFRNVEPIFMELGEEIDILENVQAFTSDMKEVSFYANDSYVNYSKVGTYEIYYSASDHFGNQTRIVRPITIQKKEKTYYISNFPTVVNEVTKDSSLLSFYRLLKFYDVPITLNEIITDLKKGSTLLLKDQKLYGADPEIEYVGDPKDQTGYGVYQRPLFELSQKYRKGMVDYTGHSLDEVLLKVKNGIPVQIWISENLEEPSSCYTWYTEKRQVDWYCNLQSVVIIGYNSQNVYVSVPYSSDIKVYQRSELEEKFNFFGKRSIFFETE